MCKRTLTLVLVMLLLVLSGCSYDQDRADRNNPPDVLVGNVFGFQLIGEARIDQNRGWYNVPYSTNRYDNHGWGGGGNILQGGGNVFQGGNNIYQGGGNVFQGGGNVYR